MFELDQTMRKQMLRFHYEAASRYPFSGSLHLNGWQLTASHCHALGRIIENSPDLNHVQLSNNNLGDEGIIALSGPLGSTTCLEGLTLRNVGMGDKGAEALLAALHKDVRVASNFVEVGNVPQDPFQNAISDGMFAKMQAEIGSSPYGHPGRGVSK